jgi:hypothetical protein
LAALAVLSVNTVNVLAAPQTQVLHHSSKQLSAAECAMWHQGAAANHQASLELRSWGSNKSTSDCVLTSEVTTQVDPNAALAWDGCYNRQSTETITSRLWPYPTLAVAYMKYGLCWTQTSIEISWASCPIATFPLYGAGYTYCDGAPKSAGSWCAVEMDWYAYAYSAPWYHMNHGMYDEWQAPLYAVSFQSW